MQHHIYSVNLLKLDGDYNLWDVEYDTGKKGVLKLKKGFHPVVHKGWETCMGCTRFFYPSDMTHRYCLKCYEALDIAFDLMAEEARCNPE